MNIMMRLFTSLLLAAGASLLPLLASAQLITDPARATVARDSVLLMATQYRQTVEQKAGAFRVGTPHQGLRRRRAKGYYVQQAKGSITTRQLAWKQRVRQLRTGVVRERYKAYIDGRKVMTATFTNQQLNYVDLRRLVYIGPTLVGQERLGLLTREGYVRWRKEQFLLPAPNKFQMTP